MKAIVFLGERKLELMDVPDPTPGPDEVVIEIKASGMCGSDLHQYRGPKKDTLNIAGHEPCGVIAAVGTGVPEALAIGSWTITIAAAASVSIARAVGRKCVSTAPSYTAESATAPMPSL